MLLVMLVLLLLFGSKDAPRMFRKLNDILSQIRRTAENFKREIMYGDLSQESNSRNSNGEYDDFGLSAYADQDEYDEKIERSDTEVPDAESTVNVEPVHEQDVGGGDESDVQKT